MSAHSSNVFCTRETHPMDRIKGTPSKKCHSKRNQEEKKTRYGDAVKIK